MYALNIDTAGLPAALNKLNALPAVINAETEASMRVSMDAFEQAVKLETPVGVSGNLRAAMTVNITGDAANITGTLSNPLAYSRWMEDATRNSGAMPPVDALELWVVRKLGLQGKAARGVAFAIAKKIQAGTSRHQKRGGAKMFEQGFANATPQVLKYWDDFAARVAARMEAE